MTDFVTAADIAQATPDIMAAPRDHGPVSMLLYRRKYNDRVFTDRLRLTRARGVEGDFEMTTPWLKLPDGTADPRIQVSILPQRVLDLCWRNRDTVVHPGDQMIADLNMSTENLPPGTLIAVGTAVLRVSDIWNEGCVKWKARCGRAAYDWTRAPAHEQLRLRGIFCSIERDGDVAVGDRISRV